MIMSNPIDNHLKSFYRLPLKDISLRRVAVLLYMSSTNVANIQSEERLAPKDEDFKDMVAKLRLPELMKERLVNVLTPIYIKTNKWLTFHEEFLTSSFDCQEYLKHLHWTHIGTINYLKHLHWTHIGTINYRKTAVAIIRDEKLDIDQRFMLACLYCLDEDIQDLWKKLSPLSKKHFYNNGKHCTYDPLRGIIVFWTCILKGRVDKLENFIVGWDTLYSSIYHYAFEFFACSCHETATQYFFEKLTSEEKDVSLVKLTQTVTYMIYPIFQSLDEVYCYLLSQMNAEQFLEVLKGSSFAILRVFLDWPRQDAFPEVAQLVLPYMLEEDYEQLHYFLSSQFKFLYNAPKLFQDLFLISPKDCRHTTYYLNDFFQRKDTESIKFMFRNMDPAETVELVFSEISLWSCLELAMEFEWDFIEFFIRESKLSKEDRGRFAVAIKSFSPRLFGPDICVPFTKLINDIS